MSQGPHRLEVIPKRGIGPAFFGMSVREVEAVLGRAVEALFDDDGEERTITLDYPGASVFFDQSEDFRFTSVEVDQECSCNLFGEALFPRSRDQVLFLLQGNVPEEDLSTLQETKDETIEEIALRIPSLRMTFYFDLSGDLQQLSWGVPAGPNDETAWPTR